MLQMGDEARSSAQGHTITTQPATVRLALEQWGNCGVVILNPEETKVTCVHLQSLTEASSEAEWLRINLGSLFHEAWRPDCELNAAFLKHHMGKP